ncbi:MAG TPA: chorismate mutase [Gammaproteobacteria bacterium]|nr:chorismate mutase [Gammaproteobacteria bacterium]
MGATAQLDSTDLIISSLRRQVDGVDERLLVLLRQRINLARQVGLIKHDAGRPLHDPQREEMLLTRLAATGNEVLPAEAIRTVFRAILDVSLARQVADAE